MNVLHNLIRQRSWPAAALASLAAHLVVLNLAMRAVGIADRADSRPRLDHPMPRSGSQIPVALVARPTAGEEARAGPSSAQAVRRIARGRDRAHPAILGPAPALADNATGHKALASGSNLALADTLMTEDMSEGHGPVDGADDSTTNQSGSGGVGASGQVAAERITELHQRLASSARRCYPPAARRLRLRGEVDLQFCLGVDGFAESRALRGSTGSALLDRASLDCVLAGALPAPGIGGCYDVRVRFSDER